MLKFKIRLLEPNEDKVLGKVLVIDFENNKVNVEFPDGNCEWYDLIFDDLLQYSTVQDFSIEQKEIYTGDILQDENGIHHEIVFGDGAFYLSSPVIDEDEVLTSKIVEANLMIKVGNVYENPQFMES